MTGPCDFMSASGFGLSLIWGFLSRWNGAHLLKAIKPPPKQNGRPFRVALTRFGAALHRPQINSLKAIRRNDRQSTVTSNDNFHSHQNRKNAQVLFGSFLPRT